MPLPDETHRFVIHTVSHQSELTAPGDIHWLQPLGNRRYSLRVRSASNITTAFWAAREFELKAGTDNVLVHEDTSSSPFLVTLIFFEPADEEDVWHVEGERFGRSSSIPPDFIKIPPKWNGSNGGG